jgi:hypothetical protein
MGKAALKIPDNVETKTKVNVPVPDVRLTDEEMKKLQEKGISYVVGNSGLNKRETKRSRKFHGRVAGKSASRGGPRTTRVNEASTNTLLEYNRPGEQLKAHQTADETQAIGGIDVHSYHGTAVEGHAEQGMKAGAGGDLESASDDDAASGEESDLGNGQDESDSAGEEYNSDTIVIRYQLH